jgi:two-component system, response regulator YesN
MIHGVASSSPRRTGFRVLVAEDEPRILSNIVKKIPLADPGFSVVATAENGEEALRLTRALSPDLLLTDIVMPMMDGLELARALRARDPTLPIAIISGYAEFEYARTAIDLGVEHYLLKPVKVDALRAMLSKVRAHLEGARREEELRALRDALGRGTGPAPTAALPRACVFLLACIGGLMDPADAAPQEMLRCCDDCWRALDADPALTERGRIERHWLVELGIPNQRLLVVSCGTPSREWIRDCAERIFNAISPIAGSWPVTLVLHPAPRALDDAYEAAQELRTALSARLAPGRSRVMTLADVDAERPAQNPLDAPEEARLRALKHKGDRARLLSAVTGCFEEWVRRELPQKAIERGCDQLVSLFECDGVSDPVTREARRGLHAALLAAREHARVPSALAAAFDAALLGHGFSLDARGIVGEVEERIARDYAQPLGIQEMSRDLGFDVSYVTRIFKKITGETPLHRLTRVRLQKAMQLLSESACIDVGTVGAMVGYPDAHYFARIFRKSTGMSPSAYRARAAAGRP